MPSVFRLPWLSAGNDLGVTRPQQKARNKAKLSTPHSIPNEVDHITVESYIPIFPGLRILLPRSPSWLQMLHRLSV